MVSLPPKKVISKHGGFTTGHGVLTRRNVGFSHQRLEFDLRQSGFRQKQLLAQTAKKHD